MTAATPASEIWQTAASERAARLRVDLSAVAGNYRTFKAMAPKAEVAGVVKANAYGLGAPAVARALAAAGCSRFFTATAAEAIAVRRAVGDGPHIVVLNGLAAEPDLSVFAAFDLSACLNSREDVVAFIAQPTRRAPALHIDTGMNRLGLRPEELGEVSQMLAPAAAPAPDLLMSHLACASTPGHPMNEAQRQAFEATVSGLFPNARRSLAASAGAQLGAAYHLDMIRPGVGLYGWDGMDEATTALRPAAFLEAPVLQIRTIRAGETCGYGATFTAPLDMRAAIVAAGYADGFLRAGSGRGYAAFGAARLPLLGRVSMDLLIFEAADAPGLKAGDHVELLGAHVPLADVAAAMGTLPYEVLTGLVGRAAR